MNRVQFTNLNTSIKKAFSAVSSDITKLNKKNSKLHEELSLITEKVSKKITSDEFYKLVTRLEEELGEKVDRDLLKSAEEQIKLRAEEIISIPNKNIKAVDSNVDKLKSEIKINDKKRNKEIKLIQHEVQKSEDLKQEVRQVKELKKNLVNLDKKFATKKKIETCFEEIDEVYDLIEELDTKSLRQTDLEKFKKEIASKLKLFEKRVDVVEDIEEELNKKTKDIFISEKKIESFKKDIISLKQRVKIVENTPQLDNKPQIDKVNISLLHEINKVDTRLLKQNEHMKDIMHKMNELVKLVNNEIGETVPIKRMYESKLAEEEINSKKIKAKVKRVEKKIEMEQIEVPTPKVKITSKNKHSLPDMPEGEPKKKSVWTKVIDWFTEEIDDDDENDEDDEEINVPKPKKVKSSSKQLIQKSKKKTSTVNKKQKEEEEEEEEPEEKKKTIWGKIADWFTEEIDDDEDEE